MSDDRPSYLNNTPQSSGLKGMEAQDLSEKKLKAERDVYSVEKLLSMRAARVAVAPPAGLRQPEWLLKGEPRDVQIEALRRSYYGHALLDERGGRPDFRPIGEVGVPRRGWAHFMQMRLGKTPVMLNEFELFRRDHGFKWMIMLTPPKFKLDWPLEAERFGLSVPTHSFISTKRDEAARFIRSARKEGGMIAVNYEALKSLDTMELLQEISGDQTYIGSDESVNIKTYSHGKQTHAMRAVQLAKMSAIKRIASGKPSTQGPHDLWMQLRFIAQISGWNPFAFKTYFCKMGGFQGNQVLGTKNAQELHDILDTCAFAARRVDWMNTPTTDYAVRKIDMIHEQAGIYKSMAKDFLVSLQDGTIVTAEQVVTKLLKLQQITSGFIIDEMSKAHEIMPVSVNPKVQYLKSMLEEEIEGKSIIFCHFNYSMDILMKALEKFNPAVIRGGMSDISVQENKKRFNNDPSCKVIIGQSKAIKYGHTLMGTPDDPCLTEIFYENSYSLDDRSQCEERAQGQGQMGSISVYDLIASDQDMAPVRALQRKEDVSSIVMRYARENGILPPAPQGVAA